MLQVSDFGGALLCLAVVGGVLHARHIIQNNFSRTTNYLRAVLIAVAALFFGVAAIYAAFAVGGGDIDPNYAVGKAVRPYGKIVDGLAALYLSVLLIKWAAPWVRSRGTAKAGRYK